MLPLLRITARGSTTAQNSTKRFSVRAILTPSSSASRTMLALRSGRAMRALRQPGRLAARRMCTAVAEEAEAAGPFSLSDSTFQGVLLCFGVTYLGAINWQRIDRQIAREAAAMKEAAHPEGEAHAEAPTEHLVDAAAPAPAAPSAVVAAVAAPRSGSANPSEWKVADVTAWLEAQELGAHAGEFKKHLVDGKLLLTLTEQDMYATLNIVSPLHRKKLALAIGDLRKAALNP